MKFFAQFETIYLWLDADEVGQRSAEKFAEILGQNRVILISPPDGPKDANDALK
jgi:DNA primase